jgi:ABC-type antimicrobial peptide transport system permease subunit
MPSRKLKQAFAFEVTVLTLMTTLVGYVIGILLVLRTEIVTFLTYMVFMNGITVLLGANFLMISNVLFGMISINRLTRIAPADFFRRYDMSYLP